MTTIFDNPNKSILDVEGLLGADDNDRMCPMIGDSTDNHVSSLTQLERMVWEDAWLTPDKKNLFRFVPSTRNTDSDGDGVEFAIKQYTELLEKEVKNKRISSEEVESFLKKAREALEVEQAEKAETQDDEPINIPYEDWERFSGYSTRHWDVSMLPKDKSEWLGEASNAFGEILEGKSKYNSDPQLETIYGFLNRLNKTRQKIEVDILDGADEVTAAQYHTEFLQENILKSKLPRSIKSFFTEAIQQFVDSPNITDEEIMLNLIRNIEESRSFYYRLIAMNEGDKEYAEEDLLPLSLFDSYEDSLKKLWLRDSQKAYKLVKEFGVDLFDSHSEATNRLHWYRYNKIKRAVAPKVLFKNKDVNRWHIPQIISDILFEKQYEVLDRAEVNKIFWTRKERITRKVVKDEKDEWTVVPQGTGLFKNDRRIFQNTAELHAALNTLLNKHYESLSLEDIRTKDPYMMIAIKTLLEAEEVLSRTKNIYFLTNSVREKLNLLNQQSENKSGWKPIWAHYRFLKEHVRS